MPARPDSIELKMQLTPEQYAAIVEEAKNAGVPITVYVRKMFKEKIEGFPAGDFIKPGTYERKSKKTKT